MSGINWANVPSPMISEEKVAGGRMRGSSTPQLPTHHEADNTREKIKAGDQDSAEIRISEPPNPVTITNSSKQAADLGCPLKFHTLNVSVR